MRRKLGPQIERRDGGGVARRVTPALLDLGRRDDDLVDRLRDRALGRTGDRPGRTAPGLDRFERQRGAALVADRDEHVRVALGSQHELEGLGRLAAGLGRVERRAAAGEEQAGVRKAPVGRHRAKPLSR